ncbi:hypothetical protein M758_3G012000 [Ceratodon purpureus]|uniref:Uncharacterized protein n=1 Tax=Ceratodon purpureus TaxID=3225 RepID=A0A8T0IH13_CERPU|nr:hypothetical protein KC19_3G012000 [Ceratodon purpureus]KAG0621336.1 hypothetical protein M758_3G012000 [Ceratodon purpureus]
MTMGLKPKSKQLGVPVFLCVLVLTSCALLLFLAPIHFSTPSMRSFRDPDGKYVITPKRALRGSLTRNAPIGFPPPPAMTSPSPPPY